MDLYLARQPIFNRSRQVVAYELLYREGSDNLFQTDLTTSQITGQMLEQTINTFGFDAILKDVSGFFNVDQAFLMEGHWRLLPAARAVLEILETVAPTPDIIAAVKAAREAGFRIALDDFAWQEGYEELLPLLSYIKVDILSSPRSEWRPLAEKYSSRGITMLAEKVEDWEQYHECFDGGYQLFQGYFFCQPEILVARPISPASQHLAQLMVEINREDLSFDNLEELISRDLALSVKLLRYLRSAGFGWRYEITTIRQALRVLGERTTRKWVSLILLTMMGENKIGELLTVSLIRARFLELIQGGDDDTEASNDYFLSGLLSSLDALLDQPLEEILAGMALNDRVRGALLGDGSLMAEVLSLIRAWELGAWDRVDDISRRTRLDQNRLSVVYREAATWAESVMAVETSKHE